MWGVYSIGCVGIKGNSRDEPKRTKENQRERERGDEGVRAGLRIGHLTKEEGVPEARGDERERERERERREREREERRHTDTWSSTHTVPVYPVLYPVLYPTTVVQAAETMPYCTCSGIKIRVEDWTPYEGGGRARSTRR